VTASEARFKPLDPDRHNRANFSSGIDQVDNFFRRTANKLSRADNLRVFVLVSDRGELIGFHAINAHSIDYAELPPRYARTRPGHGLIPAAFISMIGVDERFQGRGFGADLLFDALVRIDQAAETLGIAVILLDVLDCGDADLVARRKALYERYGFSSLGSQPLRLMLPIASARDLVRGQGH
jgi:ribosomal protein S18 acetylase RimI-like enzyme